VWGRVIDALYAASDASHRARGWEVRKGRFGARRYRLDVAAWLESQRRVERFGSTPAAVRMVRDEVPDLLDAMRWTDADIARVSPVLTKAIAEDRARVRFKSPPCTPWSDSVRARREVA
jgi:hypothetical protein